MTVVYRGDNILRGFDDDVRAHVRSEMEKEGITILTGCTVKSVDKHGKDYTSHLSNGSSVASDQVMFAIGRHPSVANLGLEKAGVAINPKNGGVAVDGWSKSSVPNIYAIGDVTHRFNLTPVAIREGHAFADTVFGKRPVQVDHSTIPTAVFSQPEVGTVGLTETQARAEFGHVDVYKATFRPIKATMSGPRHPRAHEAFGRRRDRSRARLPYRRRYRRRDHPGGCDRGDPAIPRRTRDHAGRHQPALDACESTSDWMGRDSCSGAACQAQPLTTPIKLGLTTKS